VNVSFQCSQIDTPVELEAISRQLGLGTCSSASTMTTNALGMIGAAVFGVLVSSFAVQFEARSLFSGDQDGSRRLQQDHTLKA
jgi:hypothetical protein